MGRTTIKTLVVGSVTVNVESGACQFNASSAKDFRAKLAKWHDADFDISQELAKKNDLIKNRNDSITTNNDLIADLRAGKKIIGNKTESMLLAENERFQKDIDDAKALCKELTDVQKKRLDDGNALISDELFDAYKTYCKNKQDKENAGAYYDAIAIMLHENGVAPCDDTVVALMGSVGSRAANAVQKFTSEKHNTNTAKATFKKIFLGDLCDIMADVLPKYKFQYVPRKVREERAKAEKKAKEA